MIAGLKAAAAHIWPVMRLRRVLFGALLFVAALPGVSAIFLRVYENALVRRTEAELIAQGAALSAGAALLWPSAPNVAPVAGGGDRYEELPTEIDLSSSPVLDERPAAVATAERPDALAVAMAQSIAPAIAETKRSTLASILLLDAKGIVLNGRDAGKSLAALPEVRAALAGRTMTTLRHNDYYTMRYPLEWLSRATNIRLHHIRPIKLGDRTVGAILVSRSPSALFRGMWEDRGKIAAAVASIFALLLLLTAVLARAIVKPIENLSTATRALASGRPFEPPRPTLQVQEINGLFDDFASMAAAIARRSRYLRDFAASLSHEFKTPLAGIRGGIELLQDHGETMSATERERFLANIAVDAERLSRLVKRLMELAQADMGQANADACAELAPILARLADGMAADDFVVAIDCPPQLPPLAIDPAALETVLATLIENARQTGASRLAIDAARDGDAAMISLADDGPGIAPGDRLRIFDPFFTTRRSDGGTGLGLPIARALIENSGGSLDLGEASFGTQFILRLPVVT